MLGSLAKLFFFLLPIDTQSDRAFLPQSDRVFFPQSVDEWNFDVWRLQEASANTPLRCLAYELLNRYGLLHKFKVCDGVTLCAVVGIVVVVLIIFHIIY